MLGAGIDLNLKIALLSGWETRCIYILNWSDSIVDFSMSQIHKYCNMCCMESKTKLQSNICSEKTF